ncbi:hypothetical protein UFOVP1017_30 [uncultured Caudovirales phage]|uniref:Uncharacterized protein n=1 Tax=uncultured Caudovirales phage TaxID=2100421 RepID=A0A6J5QZT3_9CAUD|nr:hypothetical protein UFOVP511_30 [uncultured Caudovirales phage]CAB4178523.1 hypothetical protein UFOVP1017_30 [uncultured Caudovirales phage]CAB4187926.1 hypothetical protein UFOVP1168_30 [uncultured Caudovirales phage]CAB4219589.1 hypothetical protein UFOVP1617_23 [uncultured Caudovirales phage]
MIKSFNVRQSFYQREASIVYNGVAGSLWVLWYDHKFCGRTFVVGARPTRLQIIESLYRLGGE